MAGSNGSAPTFDRDPVVVRLGDHDFQVVPQRVGRLRNRLGSWITTLADAQTSGGADALRVLGDKAYGFFEVFLGDGFMPRWEFEGYPTQQAYDAGEYDETYDKSPDPQQLRAAFETVLRVNELDLMRHLVKWVDPTLLKGRLNLFLANRMAEGLPDGPGLSRESRTTTDTGSTTSPTNASTAVESTA